MLAMVVSVLASGCAGSGDAGTKGGGETPLPPAAPTGIVAIAGDGQARIEWSPVAGATSYNLYHSATSGSGTAGTRIAGAVSPQVVTGLANGVLRHFVVTAVGPGGESVASSEAQATPQVAAPSTPTNVAATPGDGEATVSWTGVAGATTYNIYFATTAGAGVTGTKLSGAVSPQAVGTLTNGTPYYFVVTAVGPGGESAASLEATATPAAPVAPTFLAGSFSSCVNSSMAVATDGTLWGWGANSGGKLATGDYNPRPARTQVGTDANWKTVSLGGDFAVALKTDGTLWAWGGNGYGQLGISSADATRLAPVQVGTDADWKQAQAAGSSVVAIKNDGSLWTWGLNNQGQLGIGTSTGPSTCGFSSDPCASSPQRVGGLTTWARVAAGGNHVLAIRTDGTLWAWGVNHLGQLGIGVSTGPDTCGSLKCATAPVQVGTATSWANAWSTGDSSHTVALATDGTLWTWGMNHQGQLGTGSASGPEVCTFTQGPTVFNLGCSKSPIQVGTGSTWLQADTGQFVTVAVRSDGSLWTWGQGSGALGNAGANPYQPGQVGSATGWTSVSAAGLNDFALAAKADGSLHAWGANGAGQLGTGGPSVDQPTPVP